MRRVAALRARAPPLSVRHIHILPPRRSPLPGVIAAWAVGPATKALAGRRSAKGIDRVKRPHAHRHDPMQPGDAGGLRAGAITERDVPRLHPTVDCFVLRHILQLKVHMQQPRSGRDPVMIASRVPADRAWIDAPHYPPGDPLTPSNRTPRRLPRRFRGAYRKSCAGRPRPSLRHSSIGSTSQDA